MTQPKKSRSKQYKKKGKAKNFFATHDVGGLQIEIGSVGNGEKIDTTNFENQDNKSDTSLKRINDVDKDGHLTLEKAGNDSVQGPLSCISPRSSRSFN